jgi:hypothetical protein
MSSPGPLWPSQSAGPCATCGGASDPLRPDCCECFVCERCGARAPFVALDARLVPPAGWRLQDVHLCWVCAEHTDIGAFLEQIEGSAP